MTSDRAIFWGQGKLLTPQHLQRQDLFTQSLVRQFWSLAGPHGWGIKRLVIRSEGLAAATFEIAECEAVTREGAVLHGGTSVADPNTQVWQRSLTGSLQPGGDPLAIYLALPRLRFDDTNLDLTSGPLPLEALPKRYRLAPADQGDLFDTESPTSEVIYLDQVSVILTAADPLIVNGAKSLEIIKIAEVVPNAEGTGATLSTRYVPPSVMISASDVLMTRLKNFRDLLIGRSRDFGALARQRGVRATSAGAQDVLRLVMLQSINRYVAAFQHCPDHGHAHPEQIYLVLRELVGELSSYTDGTTALGETIDGDQHGKPIPAYDHENIWLCFDFVLSLAHHILIGLTAAPEMGVRLVHDGEYFRASLPPSFFAGERNRFYFVIDSKLPGPEMLQLLQRTGKLSTIEEMPKLREAALFGLRIHHLPVPPEELPQRNPRFVYFSIDTDSPVWKRVREGGNIAMFGRLDPTDTLVRIVKVSGE